MDRGEHLNWARHVVKTLESESSVKWPKIAEHFPFAPANRTRSATPATSALSFAAAIESSSTSTPSTVADGYARASAIVDQPAPHPISAIRTAGF